MLCAAVRKAAVLQLRSNRAPGGDGFPAVIYKTCIDSLGPRLLCVIRKVWPNETNWSEAPLLPHFKTRGGASQYAHRPICSAICISLMDLNVKVFRTTPPPPKIPVREGPPYPNSQTIQRKITLIGHIFSAFYMYISLFRYKTGTI